MARFIASRFPVKLTHAAAQLGEMLREAKLPVISAFGFHRFVWKLYAGPTDQKLYLRSDLPSSSDTSRLRQSLKKAGLIGTDPDYGKSVIRVMTVPDLPADEIVCLADPTCYVSHLSAMQRWGLTDRHPERLILSRPDRPTAIMALQAQMDIALKAGEEAPFPLRIVAHPAEVRQRPVMALETKTVGFSVQIRGSHVRVSTIGQTFLDMVQKPDLCGGMAHIIDIWEEHARSYLQEIVSAVDTAHIAIAKSRAGYILQERLGLTNPTIESWKALGQRGGSRKLDPDKDFAPEFSETWMLSLNV
ncbi:type IV toxin-antitoxin system AbiEi family antitoxin domain-containing protein [Asticcacaulis excentricus]|uniref:AbiEi antitoxin C-terminal domain-containing protein n=1 Tax=Asticcacaulis excentricus (strain ATCC 15261 / DSM 4724 / KCTC 12464 / NCIMB 9791 / VKM B-1370 / CB 48) TaxID=573065 RepID=E8RMM1_ASTEC|nr:hypothetical protein [Asticcacaulis excentricus]ADU13902.1 hypothetical protein Astex_2246 [Asticcacaulis excentricus CB 48]